MVVVRQWWPESDCSTLYLFHFSFWPSSRYRCSPVLSRWDSCSSPVVVRNRVFDVAVVFFCSHFVIGPRKFFVALVHFVETSDEPFLPLNRHRLKHRTRQNKVVRICKAEPLMNWFGVGSHDFFAHRVTIPCAARISRVLGTTRGSSGRIMLCDGSDGSHFHDKPHVGAEYRRTPPVVSLPTIKTRMC